MPMRSKRAWVEKVKLENVLRLNNMERIMTHFDEQKPDEFGCRICEHVLLNIEKQFRTDEFSVRFTRLQTDGDTWLHSIEEFKKIQNVIPISNPAFSKDQFGISNQSRPDGVFVIEVCTVEGHCRQKIPVFVEVDTGNEQKFQKQSRIIAMKMWQSVAVGQWIEKSSTVVTLRIETQLMSKALVQKARKGHRDLDEQTLIFQHLRDLSGACTEILHAVTLTCVLAHFNLESDNNRTLYDHLFFGHLIESMNRKDRRDFHFFVGPFGFNLFDLDNERMVTPAYRGNALPISAQTMEEDIFKTHHENVFNNVTNPGQYFKNGQDFKRFKNARDGADYTARFVDGFWQNQSDWKCEMGYQRKEYDKNTSILTSTELIHSRIPMHCINVKRTEIDDLVVPPLVWTTPGGVAAATVTATKARMPNNMFYIQDIFSVLDKFIQQASQDPLRKNALPALFTNGNNEIAVSEYVLRKIMDESFILKANIRIPDSHSYTELATTKTASETFITYFFKWSGFHLFIEPFIAVMENTLFRITSNASEKTDEFQSYGKQMTEFRRNIARNEFQLNTNRHRVDFPRDEKKLSSNLASRCLLSYDNDKLDPELQSYLYDKSVSHSRTLNNEYLVLACKWLKCYDRSSLLALVQHYMTNEAIRSSIDKKLSGLAEGTRSEILYMFEVVFTDTRFLLKKREDERAKGTVLAFDDDDLESGIFRMYVRVHWIPYELQVNFDRLGWRHESVYDFNSNKWLDIDTGMSELEFNNLQILKVKNTVKKVFGFQEDNKKELLNAPGTRLWKSGSNNGKGLLWKRGGDTELRDRTRLLCALSLTNLKLVDWYETQDIENLEEKCRMTHDTLDTLKNHVSENIQFLATIRNQGGIEEHILQRLRGIEKDLDVPDNKASRVWKSEDFITKLCRCKVDFFVLTANEVEETYIQQYFVWRDLHYTIYEYWNSDRLRDEYKADVAYNGSPVEYKEEDGGENDDENGLLELTKEAYMKMSCTRLTNLALKNMKYRVVPNPNPRLSKKDIILHEALGTYFGLGYKQKKGAQFRLYIYERFPIFRKRFVPYQRWTMGNKRMILRAKSIINEIHTVKQYQKRNSIVIFPEEDINLATDEEAIERRDPGCLQCQTKIRNFLFQNNQVLFRFMHVMWSWKWILIKLLCLQDYREWYVGIHTLQNHLDEVNGYQNVIDARADGSYTTASESSLVEESEQSD